MAKVTSKLQLTVPKAIADRYAIRPGDELDWVPAGETIRVIPPKGKVKGGFSLKERLALFDQATERQRRREAALGNVAAAGGPDRGWKREDVYRRGPAD
ncbi:MAG TPA: AbrB/MazE/SpoVT family DNA-binding domain-containing protein [Terriglobales bacterium]|jgi:bifunctional DNA-binding transcriptional regulator/antitoxin component of YhaV-PrlF toxin-antitoxin module